MVILFRAMFPVAAVSLLVIFLEFQDDPLFATYMLLVASSSAVIVPLALAVDFGDERKRDEQNLFVLQERERLARDVQDLLGHSLTVINLKAELRGRSWITTLKWLAQSWKRSCIFSAPPWQRCAPQLLVSKGQTLLERFLQLSGRWKPLGYKRTCPTQNLPSTSAA